MSRPRFIPCAYGNNVHETIGVIRYGDLVRVIAPGYADMTPANAAALADALRDLAVECGWDDPEKDDCK